MRRRRRSWWLIGAGLAAWFMPWTASASAPGTLEFDVACPAAPVDLLVYSQVDGWGSDQSNAEVARASASGACRTSAWWRTMLGTLLLAIGFGRTTRGRTHSPLAGQPIANGAATG